MPLVLPEIKIAVSYDRKVKKSELHTIKTSQEAADILRKVFNADTFDWTEEFVILCLNQANKVIGFSKISSGGLTGTVADPRVVLTIALQSAAAKIMLAHNHPSGTLKPSRADQDLTNKIRMAAAYLDIAVVDHIILTDESHYSFLDEGLL